jgi:hypothetical protein
MGEAMRIIGLGHKKNQGKDTFARLLKTAIWNEYQQDFQIVSLSDVLFDAAHVLFGYAGCGTGVDYSVDYEAKDKLLPGLYHTPRDLAKDMGDLIRKYDSNGLLKATVANAKHSATGAAYCGDPTPHGVIVTNIRFPNEAEYVSASGGKMLLINRPSIPHDLDDPFDTALDDYQEWDAEIINDKDIAKLRDCAKIWSMLQTDWFNGQNTS